MAHLTPIMQKDIHNILVQNVAVAELRNHSVLISGATGFIGSYLVHTLAMDAQKNNGTTRIYALVRSAAKARLMFGDYESHGLIHFIEQDICAPLTFETDVDYIIHCASNAAPKEYANDPVGTMNTNFRGTAHLLDYAKAHLKQRFLYVSTIEVYGAMTESKAFIQEDEYGLIDSCNPRSCYPISKKACETLCISYGKQYRIPVSIGRLAYIYGPGMKSDDSKIAALFPREVANGNNIVMKSAGLQKRSYCYVTDAISGLLTVLEHGENQQAYNIASRECITTIRNMAEHLVALFPEKNLEVIFECPTDQEKQAFSFIADAVLSSERLESIGWSPVTKFDEGLYNTVKDYEYRIAKQG